MTESRRLVSTFVPQPPVWAVYLDDNEVLFTLPVLAFTVWESQNPDDGLLADIEPVFAPEFLVEGDDGHNMLGFSLIQQPSPDVWKDEIEYMRRKRERALSGRTLHQATSR